MRVGIDGTCWANERGYGRFAREITAEMFRRFPGDRFVCFVDHASRSRYSPAGPNVEMVQVDVAKAASHAASAGGYRSPRDMLAMTRAVARENMDVFFSPSVYTYFPLPLGLRAVVTIHDAIAERFPGLTVPSARARLFWRLKVRLALFQARRILTVSEYAARDVNRIHRVPRERIDIAVEAPAREFIPRSHPEVLAEARLRGLREGDRWFIYVGGFNPHKNVSAIVAAHAEIVRELKDGPPHLFLVGTLDGDVFHADIESIERAIRGAGTAALVHFTGFVPDEPLSALHSGAIALLLPSEVEGFGLPAVEAAACGAPVIATEQSPLPQLLDGGGIFITPSDKRALAVAMHRLATDDGERDAMGARALGRARSLSWSSAADAAMSSLRVAAS